jgi:TonB-linked SusC/RagA family outer membrane protein
MSKKIIIAGGSSLRVLPLFCAAILSIPATGWADPVHKPTFPSNYFFQQQISGIVTSAINGTPVVGASVVIKGTTTGTTTNEEGRFTIAAKTGDVLVITYLGFQTSEITVSQNSNVSVQLRDDVQSLDQVVVVGYGTQKRKEITSAVTTVKSTNFNPGGTRSPLDLIQGKVAGLSITRTQGNNPNSGAEIQLRGVTSLTGTRTPLIVIDGIPGGNLDLLQQDDIESFDVLKDGSAAAIYGTRGNAGVILITTKKGKSGAPRYDFSTYLQREYVDRKPEYLTASDFRKLIADGVVAPSQDFGASTDLYDELIDKNNLSQYYNFSASGGTAQTNYRASLFYNDANGIAKQNGREQFGGRVNVNQRGLDDRLSLSVNIAANVNKANLLGGGGGDFEQAIQRNPTAPIYNPDGTYFETQGFNNYNPLSRLAYRISERDQQTFSGDAMLSLKLMKGLTASTFVSYVRNAFNDRYYRSRRDWDQRPNSDYQGMAYASKSNFLNWSRTLESTVNYTREIADKHNITALAGYSYQYETTETFNVNNNGFTTDGFLDWNLGAGSAIQNTTLPRPGMGSNKVDNTLIAFFGRVNYSFADRYFLTAILRREGSSRFGANHKWGNFPAVSLGWIISDEAFMQNINQVNQLKLRIGYGVTGNQGIPNYQSIVTLGTGGYILRMECTIKPMAQFETRTRILGGSKKQNGISVWILPSSITAFQVLLMYTTEIPRICFTTTMRNNLPLFGI